MPRISRTASFVAGGLLAASGLVAGSAAASSGSPVDLLRAPVQGSLTTDPALFGVSPGAAPWVIRSGEAKVESDGTVKVSLTGLLIPGVGVGPVRTVSAGVVCNGTPAATTGAVPLSTAGDAEVKATVALPDRCLAPAVLIHPNGNASLYIAATGH
jgi:hypothetical protein